MDELTTLTVSKILMEGAEGERMATKDYARQLAEIYAVSKYYGDLCAPDISEIMADELNHDMKLQALFTKITDVAPKKD